MHSKTEQAVEFLNDGTMKLSKRQQEIHAETTGDLKAKMAMQRRALAYHIAGVCSFPVVDGLIQRMFNLMTKEPVKGFRAVSLQQIINADREMWMQAAQLARGQTLTNPTKPLNNILKTAFAAPETSYHLLPLPGSNNPGNAAPKEKPSRDNPRKRKFDGSSRPNNRKGNSKGKGIDLPTGCVAETGAGQRICFQFNRQRCNFQDKDRCVRGLHVCWKKGCGGKHPFADCKS